MLKNSIDETHSPLESADFEGLVLDCVIRTLEEYGPNVKRIVMWWLTQMDNINRVGILSTPEEFVLGLQGLFGSDNAKLVERRIVREMVDCFGIENFESESFVLAVKEARRRAAQSDT